ncbi:cytoskeleton-associated protein 2-like [Mytilus edulis]|uniref:cytoskeleton-associated protein 2-like n=1 Tax=Mytilus edulis TaxID=6550 RepID=UPI0039F04156
MSAVSSKKDEYLQKFQKYKDEKEKHKKDQRLQISSKIDTLKPQNPSPKSWSTKKKSFTGVKPTAHQSTVSQHCKENKKPFIELVTNTLTDKPRGSKPLPEKQISKSAPVNRKTTGSVTEAKKVQTSTSNVRKSFGHVNKVPNLAGKPRKSLPDTCAGNPRKSLPGTSNKKFHITLTKSIEVDHSKLNQNGNSRKSLSSNGNVRRSVSNNENSRKSVSNKDVNSRQSFSVKSRRSIFSVNVYSHRQTSGVNNKNVKSDVPKSKLVMGQRSRRHSDIHKEQRKSKPASILKRKSCFASIDIEGAYSKTPDHGRSVRFISPDDTREDHNTSTFRKTPKRSVDNVISDRQPTPKYSAKKPRHNEEQVVMRNKLDEWLKSKGKTPSKFRHLMCFHDDNNKTDSVTDSCIKRSLTVEELTEQKATIDREDNIAVNLADQFRDAALEELDSMLEECTTLFEAGCPREDILSWLDSIKQNIQLSKTYAKFYICKANVLKGRENLEEVLKVYEEAVINSAQPAHELATALTSIVKDICQKREKKARRRSAADVQEENIFESSAIKYTVRQMTPLSKKRRKSASDVKRNSPCVVITPVRRSTRRSISCLPSNLQDKNQTYKSLEDVSDKKKTLFFPNEALNYEDLDE